MAKGPVKVRIVERPAAEEKQEEVVPPKPPEPKKIPPKSPETRIPRKTAQDQAQKVQGLTEESLATNSNSNFVAPLGNTLMAKDEGKRLRPEEIAALKRNLSSEAILIQDTYVAPKYSEGALAVNLEGAFPVDVYVDAKGNVIEVELRKKIGYAMDQSVIDAVKQTRLFPRKMKGEFPLRGGLSTPSIWNCLSDL